MSLAEQAFGPVANQFGQKLASAISPATNEAAAAAMPPIGALSQDWQAREFALAQREHAMNIWRQDVEAMQREVQAHRARELWDRVKDIGIGALIGGGSVAIIVAIGRFWGGGRR